MLLTLNEFNLLSELVRGEYVGVLLHAARQRCLVNHHVEVWVESCLVVLPALVLGVPFERTATDSVTGRFYHAARAADRSNPQCAEP